jgi:hypothetical protein
MALFRYFPLQHRARLPRFMLTAAANPSHAMPVFSQFMKFLK